MEEIKEEKKEIDFGQAFGGLFESTSGTGDEELLRVASTYSRQITGRQMKALLFLRFYCYFIPEEQAERIRDFLNYWLELKQFNNSAQFVMRALDSISLRKFLGENAIKANIEKRG